MDKFLEISLLGGLSIKENGVAITELTRKEIALFIYLVCTGKPHQREVLAELFWNERSQKRSSSNLRTLLTRLRQTLGDYIEVTRQTLAFNTESHYRLDVTEFETELLKVKASQSQTKLLSRSTASRLSQALSLYKGNFLSGFYLPDAYDFDTWITLERERFHRDAAEGFQLLVEFHLQRGQYTEGIKTSRQLLTMEPYNEVAHRQLITLLAYNNQREAALAQYESCSQVLNEELGVGPDKETKNLIKAISAGTLTAATKPTLAAASSAILNLPNFLTSFVGRQKELAHILERLNQPDCRLLTLVGGGGIGKSRLAVEVAAYQLNEFIDGVCFIHLEAVTQASMLVPIIAGELNFQLTSLTDTKKQLFNYLRSKEILLIFDTFEHLVENGTNFLLEILQNTTELKIIVTSRERLNLQAEYILRLEGLPFPTDLSNLPNLESFGNYGAIQLFLDRAQAVEADFAVSAGVGQICQQVEGMPLGIELAAALVGHASCEEISQKIEENIKVLTTTLRDVPSRHRSLWAVFEQSWQLLTEPEQFIFAQCGIFQGGFSQEAAVFIMQANSFDLATLVNKSLIRRTKSSRYEIHKLLVRFAMEKLAIFPFKKTQSAIEERHRAFYLNFLTEQEAVLNTKKPPEVVAALWSELDNIRQAWYGAVKQAVLPLLAQSSTALSQFFAFVGLLDEGVIMMTTAIERARMVMESDLGDAPKPAQLSKKITLGKLLAALAFLLVKQSKNEASVQTAQEVVELAQTGKSVSLETMGHLTWGWALLNQGLYDSAQAKFEQSLALACQTQLRRLEADSLKGLGTIDMRQNNYADAEIHYERSLQIYHEIDGLQGKGEVLHSLGTLFHYQDKYEEAAMYYDRALFVYDEIDDRRGKGRTFSNLGALADSQSDFANAKIYYEKALQIFRQMGDFEGQANVLGNLGISADYLGDYISARTYTRQTLQLQSEMGARHQESIALANLSLHAHHLGDNVAAKEYSQQALQLAQHIGGRQIQGYAWLFLGHALTELHDWDGATTAYQNAYALWQELKSPPLAIETQAGLARLYLVQDNLPLALAQVEEILAYLEHHNLEGTEEPFRIYLTCYQVLQTNPDDSQRAAEILNTAHALLLKRAAKINDAEMQRSFLEKVKPHQEIVALIKGLDWDSNSLGNEAL